MGECEKLPTTGQALMRIETARFTGIPKKN